MKTIFYIPLTKEKLNDDEIDYFFDNIPHKEFLVIENYLYEKDTSINIVLNQKNKRNLNVTIKNFEDNISEEGIIRRISLYSYYL